jgi:hypothetical protein
MPLLINRQRASARRAGFACGLLAVAIGSLCSTPALADANTAIDEVVGICAASIIRPGAFEKSANDQGYELAGALDVSATQKVKVLSKGDRSISVNDHTFSDATAKSCVMTVPEPFTLDDVKALKTRLEADSDIGKLDGEPGTAQPPGTEMKMLFGSFKRPGVNPFITFNIFSSGRFTTISFSRMEQKAKD